MLAVNLPVAKMVMDFVDAVGDDVAVAAASAAGVRCACGRYNACHQVA